VVDDPLSVSLFKLPSAASTPQSERNVILAEAANFLIDIRIDQGLTTTSGTWRKLAAGS